MSRAAFLLLLLYFSPSQSKEIDRNNIKHSYKFVRCKSFDPQTIKFEICGTRVEKNWRYFDIGFRVLKTLNKPFFLQYTIARKTKDNYFQDYFRTELIEICGVMEGAKNTNPFLKGVLAAVGSSAPELIHPCPYNVGFVNATNIKYDTSKTFYFPIYGHFKIELMIYSKKKTPMTLFRTDEERSGSVDFPKNI